MAGARLLVLRGDARALPLPDDSVDLVVTSPPFYALRSYTDGGVHYDGQIGSEPTPAEYIDNLVACTAEWMRILKPGGSMFVDLGDKYASYEGNRGDGQLQTNGPRGQTDQGSGLTGGGFVRLKSLMLLPERYRIACVDRLGLIARAVIVWAKPNGLPESVTDRVRRSHEDWVHLVKAPRYYSAVDEIREAYVEAQRRGVLTWDQRRGRDDRAARYSDQNGHGGTAGMAQSALGKLPGSVWSIPSEPLQVPLHLGIDHFAAFPTEWPRRLILGWSPPGICTACGEGRRPVVDRPGLLGGDNNPESRSRTRRFSTMDGGAVNWARRMAQPDRITGYVCACTPYTDHPGTAPTWKPWRNYHLDGWTSPPTRPSVILDPFGGTGTTALVASVLGRIGVTVDRSADYCRLAAWRTSDPGEWARALRVPKPEPVADTQLILDWEVV